MCEKRLCLAGEDSLRMLRFARRSEGLILAPAEKSVLRDCDDAVDAQTLVRALPSEIFVPSRQQPVCLRFDDDASRSQSAFVHAVSGLAHLPDSAYLEVLTVSGDPLVARGGDVTHVLVESAGMSLVSAADIMGGVSMVLSTIELGTLRHADAGPADGAASRPGLRRHQPSRYGALSRMTA